MFARQLYTKILGNLKYTSKLDYPSKMVGFFLAHNPRNIYIGS